MFRHSTRATLQVFIWKSKNLIKIHHIIYSVTHPDTPTKFNVCAEMGVLHFVLLGFVTHAHCIFYYLTLSFIRQLSWFWSPSLNSLPCRGFMKLKGSRQSLSSEGSATMNGSTCCPPTCAIAIRSTLSHWCTHQGRLAVFTITHTLHAGVVGPSWWLLG